LTLAHEHHELAGEILERRFDDVEPTVGPLNLASEIPELGLEVFARRV
jgi:hypothetical protein